MLRDICPERITADRACIPFFSGLSTGRDRPRWHCLTSRGTSLVIDWKSQSPALMRSGGAAPLILSLSLSPETDRSRKNTMAAVYLCLPVSGEHPTGLFDWGQVGKVVPVDAQSDPGAIGIYAGLMEKLLSACIPLPDSAWHSVQWCEEGHLCDELAKGGYARMLLHTSAEIGADIELFFPRLHADWLLQSCSCRGDFQRRLKSASRWLPPIELCFLLPSAHMSPRDLHRIRCNYVIRLSRSVSNGEQRVVSGLALGGDTSQPSGWSPMAWNFLLHWQPAESSDQFEIMWSEPVENPDELHVAAVHTGAEDEKAAASPLSDASLPSIDSHLLVTLECVIGSQSFHLEDFMQIRPGELLSVSGWNWPVVTLRLAGKTLGKGELVQCGDELAVQITQWYPAESVDEQPV